MFPNPAERATQFFLIFFGLGINNYVHIPIKKGIQLHHGTNLVMSIYMSTVVAVFQTFCRQTISNLLGSIVTSHMAYIPIRSLYLRLQCQANIAAETHFDKIVLSLGFAFFPSRATLRQFSDSSKTPFQDGLVLSLVDRKKQSSN